MASEGDETATSASVIWPSALGRAVTAIASRLAASNSLSLSGGHASRNSSLRIAALCRASLCYTVTATFSSPSRYGRRTSRAKVSHKRLPSAEAGLASKIGLCLPGRASTKLRPRSAFAASRAATAYALVAAKGNSGRA